MRFCVFVAEKARAVVRAIDPEPILQKAVNQGAEKGTLWAHWNIVPNKPLCRIVFWVSCSAQPVIHIGAQSTSASFIFK